MLIRVKPFARKSVSFVPWFLLRNTLLKYLIINNIEHAQSSNFCPCAFVSSFISPQRGSLLCCSKSGSPAPGAHHRLRGQRKFAANSCNSRKALRSLRSLLLNVGCSTIRVHSCPRLVSAFRFSPLGVHLWLRIEFLELFANNRSHVKWRPAILENTLERIGHHFERTRPIADSLQAIGIGGDERFWAEQ